MHPSLIISSIVSAVIMLWLFVGDDIVIAINKMAGRSASGLTKKQAKKLQREHAEAVDILREIDAYDRFAVNALPTAVHERLRSYLDQQAGRPALPPRSDA